MNYDYYENCYRISCNIKVNRKDVYFSLKNLFSIEDLNDIAVIRQEKNYLKWLICVKNEKTFEKYLYNEIEILGKIVVLENVNDFVLNFRILWLPPTFNAKMIASYVSEVFNISSENVVYIKDEKCNESEMEKISNGNWNIVLKIDLYKHDKSTFSGGIKTVKNVKSLFIRKDEKRKCLFCEKIGHIKKNCPKFTLFCTICKKRGHENKNCSTHENIATYESVVIHNEILIPMVKTEDLAIQLEESDFQKYDTDEDDENDNCSCSSTSDYSDQFGRLPISSIPKEIKEPNWNKIIEDVNKNLEEDSLKELKNSEIVTSNTKIGLVEFILKIL